MTHTVYFADKAAVFAVQEPLGASYVLFLAAGERINRAKVLKILETQNYLAVISPEADAVFASYAADFVFVEAAGGIVVNRRGEWLMIHRNGRWDLPKGHLEAGETLAECAVREVTEETGVRCAQVVRPLCDTLHSYNLHGRWELKCTHWFELRVENDTPLAPQREEGIDRAEWCSPARVAENLQSTFPTICHVAECMTQL